MTTGHVMGVLVAVFLVIIIAKFVSVLFAMRREFEVDEMKREDHRKKAFSIRHKSRGQWRDD